MKKLISILSFLLSFGNLSYSLDGNGTIGNPYSGSVTANTTITPGSGIMVGDIPTLYATSIEIQNNATLTIAEGGLLTFFNASPSYTLTINPGCTLIIQPNACVTVHQIINNGTLRMESNFSEFGSASLIVNSYSVSPSAVTEIQMYQPGGAIDNDSWWWHYISVPISNVPSETFNIDGNPYAPYDLAQYVEPLVTDIYNESGWVCSDGYQYHTGNTLVSYSFSSLTLGKGYNFYHSGDANITLTTSTGGGQVLNLSDQYPSVSCTSGPEGYSGFNLIGNPFSSFLDWDVILNSNYPYFLNRAIYFTMYDQVASYIYPFETNGGTGKIPPMQGFFVHANDDGVVPLSASARTHKLNQLRLKGSSDQNKDRDTISFVRLKLEDQKTKSDLIVYFNKKATSSFDGEFDAFKIGKSNASVSTWSKMGNLDLSINGIPFPENTIEIPIGINVKEAGIYKLFANELNKLDNYSVLLKDLLTNTTADLKKGEILTFNTSAGTFEDRFILSFTNLTTDVPSIVLPEKKFSIYSKAGIVNILSLTDDFSNKPGVITIYDLAGRKIKQQQNVEWNGNGELKQIILGNNNKGLIIIEIKAGNKKYVEKINING